MSHRFKPSKQDSWWLRNRLWLAAVVPSVALMLGASSFRYADIYMPNVWSDAIELKQGEWGSIDTHQVVDGLDIDVKAEMQAEGVQNLGRDTIPEIKTPDGTNLWMVSTQWKADPEAPLKSCDMIVFDEEGREYAYMPRLMETDNFDLSSGLSEWVQCVPATKPGPDFPSHFDFAGDEKEPSTRPPEWRKATLFVLPEGVTPVKLKVGWYEPHHFEVKLDEPRTDLFKP